jgi:proteic killer suppression protein
MIVSYRDRKTERFANGQRVKEFSGFARQAEVRLDRLEAAGSLKDLGRASRQPTGSPTR